MQKLDASRPGVPAGPLVELVLFRQHMTLLVVSASYALSLFVWFLENDVVYVQEHGL